VRPPSTFRALLNQRFLEQTRSACNRSCNQHVCSFGRVTSHSPSCRRVRISVDGHPMAGEPNRVTNLGIFLSKRKSKKKMVPFGRLPHQIKTTIRLFQALSAFLHINNVLRRARSLVGNLTAMSVYLVCSPTGGPLSLTLYRPQHRGREPGPGVPATRAASRYVRAVSFTI